MLKVNKPTHDDSGLRRQIETLETQNMELSQEINKLNFKIKRLEEEGSYEAFEWKIKYEESVS